MIDALKSEEIVEKFGGRFKLTAVIQRRLVQLLDGARPMVERNGRSDLEVVIQEILEDKLAIVEQTEDEAAALPAADEPLL
ncbi:MAG: DNA-directed RNA polymerase subunit omega [Planctomycetota bacterium]